MSKYIVRYSTENAAEVEGRKMWKAVKVLAIIIIAIYIIF